jgi:hypothetical protein
MDDVPNRRVEIEGRGGFGVAGIARGDRGSRLGQAAWCTAQSTPPPPSRDSFAAVTIASTCSATMSPTTTSIVATPP